MHGTINIKYINYAVITKNVVMSVDQNAGRSYSIRADNSSSERVEEFNFNRSKFYSGKY